MVFLWIILTNPDYRVIFDAVLKGVGVTVRVTLISYTIAVVLGLIIAVVLLSTIYPARKASEVATPAIDPANDRPFDVRLREQESVIEASGLFGPVTVRRYPYSATYTAERYARLLNTYSAVRSLPPETRRGFLARVQELVEQFGGMVETRYVAVLFLAPGLGPRPASPGDRQCACPLV